MKRIVFAVALLALANVVMAQYRFTRWPADKKVSVVFTFDDAYSSHFDFCAPRLSQRGLKGTFFIITGGMPWSSALANVDTTHEFGGHSLTDVNFKDLDTATIRNHLAGSIVAINQNLPGRRVLSIAWQYGYGGGSKPKEDTIRAMAAQHYLFARNAGSGTGYDPYLHYQNSYFNLPGRNYYLQTGSYIIASTTTANAIGNLIRSAIPTNGRIALLYHAVGPSGYNKIDTTTFLQHADTVKSFASQAWFATFSQQSIYQQLVRFSKLNTVSEDSAKWVVAVTDTLPDSVFNIPLTVKLALGGRQVFAVMQGTDSVPYTVAADTITFDILPTGKPYSLVKQNVTSVPATRTIKPAFAFYPNPANGIINVSCGEPTQVLIYDLGGRKMFENYLELGTSTIDISQLPKGVYLLRNISQSQSSTSKLMVD